MSFEHDKPYVKKEPEYYDRLWTAGRITLDECTEPEPVLSYFDTHRVYTLACAGDLIVIAGKAKSGKSAIGATIMGATQVRDANKTMGFLYQDQGPNSLVVHVDTEQTQATISKMLKIRINRIGFQQMPDTIISASFENVPLEDRWAVLEKALETLTNGTGKVIGLIYIDHLADFSTSVNDEKQNSILVNNLTKLIRHYGCVAITNIHENESTKFAGSPRGHLGSDLFRRCSCCINVTKESYAKNQDNPGREVSFTALRHAGFIKPFMIRFSFESYVFERDIMCFPEVPAPYCWEWKVWISERFRTVDKHILRNIDEWELGYLPLLKKIQQIVGCGKNQAEEVFKVLIHKKRIERIGLVYKVIDDLPF